MKCACLAWGSLVWDPRTLPRAGAFQTDGPSLPIDFSRVSQDGRVTLVIDPEAPRLQTLWVLLAAATLEDAAYALGVREKIAPERRADWVGRFQRGDALASDSPFENLDGWLARHELDAVVWTALPPRSPAGEFARPSLESLVAHLASLEGASRERAEEYIRRTPSCVATPRRARFEAEFGWTPRTEVGDE